MAKQVSALRAGNDYQDLYCWYELLDLLPPESPWDYALIEHDDAGSADDLTLYPRLESKKPAQFFQIKFHTDHRGLYTFESMIAAPGAAKSLLAKLFESWRLLRERHHEIEIWLVSNWHPDAGLGAAIGGNNCIKEEFWQNAPATKWQNERSLWKTAVDAGGDEFAAFCADLRLDFSYSDELKLIRHVDERMQYRGLRTGQEARLQATEQINRWIKAGREHKRITRNTLREVIGKLGLWAGETAAPRACLEVHGWKRQFYLRPADRTLDFTPFFQREGRHIPDSTQWSDVILPAIEQVRRDFEARGVNLIDLQGLIPLTLALAIGFSFPLVGRYRFRLEQPTGGKTSTWSSDDDPAPNRCLAVTHEEEFDHGEDLLLSISLIHSALKETAKFAETMHGVKALIYAEAPDGPGLHSLGSGGEAMALAAHAKELIREGRRKYDTRRTHLLVYAPYGFCVFLGQHLNAVGDVITYERDASDCYQQSVILRTD